MKQELLVLEKVLDEKVRPALHAHGGEVRVEKLDSGTLYVRLLGRCSDCPSACLTTESLIETELTADLPRLVQHVSLVQEVSEDLLEQARKLMNHGG